MTKKGTKRGLRTLESEELRRKWAKSAIHDVAWPKLESFCKKVGWRGYDLVHDTL